MDASRIILEPVWPWWVCSIITGVFVVLALVGYQKRPANISRKNWTALIALRFAAIAILALALFKPVFEGNAVEKVKGYLLYLIDHSASMGIKDGPDRASRQDVLQDAFNDRRYELEQLQSKYDLKIYGFGEEAFSLISTVTDIDKNSTAIGQSILNVLRENNDKPVIGVVLFSDGTNNLGIAPAAIEPLLTERKIHVYSVGVGSASPQEDIKDIWVQQIVTNSSVFVNNVFPVEATVSCMGLAARTVTVTLMMDEEVIDQKDIVVKNQMETQKVLFQTTPRSPGFKRLTVKTTVFNDEILKDNNQAIDFVTVLSEGLKVLYLEGKLKWEYRFLKSSLQDNKQVDFIPVLILSSMETKQSGVITLESSVGTSLAAFPKTANDWRYYDVVILGDIPRYFLSTDQMKGLKEAVAGGTGLLVVAGKRNFGRGQFQNTPLADLLPVTISQPEEEIVGRYYLKPTLSGLSEQFLKFDKDLSVNERIWNVLPQLIGGIRFNALKPAAIVYADDGAGTPILVGQPFGKGRVLAFATDSTYRWAFNERDTLQYHKQFWNQMLLWLSGRESFEKTNVTLQLDKYKFLTGEDVPLKVFANDENGKELENLRIEGELFREGEEKPTSFSNFAYVGHYEKKLQLDEPGVYTVRLSAFDGNDKIATPEASFLIYRPQLEFQELRADLDLLKGLAESTEGAYYSVNDLSDLIRTLIVKESIVDKVHQSRKQLWNTWWMLILFLGIISLEWVLRKMVGLV